MIIEINDKGFLEREIIIKLSKKELDLAKEKKIVDLSKSLNLKGFRVGFIPRSIIISRFESQIDNDVLNDILYKNLIDFIKKNSVNFVKFPNIKTIDYTSFVDYILFIFEFEIYPIIDVNFEKMKLIKYKSCVNDVDIDSEIYRLRNMYGTWNKIECVSIGDKVSFEIFDKRNKLRIFFDTDVIVDKDYTSLSGFLNFIVGKAINVDYFVSFSNNFIAESLDTDSGYIFKIIDIKQFHMSCLDLSFYNKIGFDGSYDIRSFIRTSLNGIQSDLINVLLKHDMLSLLVASHDFHVPNSILNDKLSEFKNKGVIKGEIDVLNEVKLDLLLKEIIKKFNIYVSKDEVLKMLHDKYKNQSQIDKDFYSYIENEIYIEKIKEVLLTKIYIEEKEIKFSDLLSMGNNL